MKYKFHDEKVLHRIKPWVYLSTYILLLAFFLMHVQDVVNGFDFVLSLFRSLLYAIVFAYVLNLPMKKIESFIIRHTKETSLLRKRKRMVFNCFFVTNHYWQHHLAKHYRFTDFTYAKSFVVFYRYC